MMPSRFTLAFVAAALSISPAQRADSRRRRGRLRYSRRVCWDQAGKRIRRPGFRATAWPAVPRDSIRGMRSGRGAKLLPYPYFYSDSDAGYDSGEAAPPQVIVVPASAPAPPPAPPAPRESLLIEWQGDHFVRTTMSAKAGTGEQLCPTTRRNPRCLCVPSGRSAPGRKNTLQTPRELPPAVLVFHDGRNEEVSEYTIMSGTIYSKADYWTTGSWTRKIQIADLDMPATLRLNQERGLKFVLPASPNEVVVRP